MTTPTNYIATWFYKESKEDASFYPQAFHLYADTSAVLYHFQALSSQ